MLSIPKSVFVFLLVNLTFLSGIAFAHKDGGIVVKNAWIREAPPVSKVLAAYMTIENHTADAKELVNVKSTLFTKIEIHKTVDRDGMASMEKQSKVNIPPEGSVELKPGGLHLMLFNPTQTIKAGNTVNFVLEFSNGSKINTGAIVKKGNIKNGGHHHNHGHGDNHSHNSEYKGHLKDQHGHHDSLDGKENSEKHHGHHNH